MNSGLRGTPNVGIFDSVVRKQNSFILKNIPQTPFPYAYRTLSSVSPATRVVRTVL